MLECQRCPEPHKCHWDAAERGDAPEPCPSQASPSTPLKQNLRCQLSGLDLKPDPVPAHPFSSVGIEVKFVFYPSNTGTELGWAQGLRRHSGVTGGSRTGLTLCLMLSRRKK